MYLGQMTVYNLAPKVRPRRLAINVIPFVSEADLDTDVLETVLGKRSHSISHINGFWEVYKISPVASVPNLNVHPHLTVIH